MDGTVNKVFLVGRAGANPEERVVRNVRCVIIPLCTTKQWETKEGRVERKEWHSVVVWNKGLGDILLKYGRTGTKISVIGELQTRVWKDDSGIYHKVTEVVLERYGGGELTFV